MHERFYLTSWKILYLSSWGMSSPEGAYHRSWLMRSGLETSALHVRTRFLPALTSWSPFGRIFREGSCDLLCRPVQPVEMASKMATVPPSPPISCFLYSSHLFLGTLHIGIGYQYHWFIFNISNSEWFQQLLNA